MTNLIESKFDGCRECFFFQKRTTACRTCDAGENFQADMDELDPSTLDLGSDDGDDDE